MIYKFRELLIAIAKCMNLGEKARLINKLFLAK